MYPSVRVKLIKKALQHYSHSLPEEAKWRVNLVLAMVKFGMRNMLVNFFDKFNVYQGAAKGQDLLEEDVALAICAFESVFLADLVALFVFEKTAANKLTGGDDLQFTTELWRPVMEESQAVTHMVDKDG
eukprot:68309-Ditylum_brightwellii.AAC.1